MGTFEVVVHPVVVAALVVAAVIILVGKGRVQRHEVDVPIARPGHPGEMVDASDGGGQRLPGGPGDAVFPCQHVAQQLLGAEYLVAAAEGLDLREYVVQRAHAQAHGVGVVNHPGVGGICPDGLADLHKHGDGAHGPHETARADGVAHGLPDAHPLGQVHVRAHLLKGGGEDRYDHEIRAPQRALQGIRHLIFPAGGGIRMGADARPDALVAQGGGAVDVVKADGAAHIPVHGQVCHESPGPAPRTAADVSDAQLPCPFSIVSHIPDLLCFPFIPSHCSTPSALRQDNGFESCNNF